MSTLITRKRFTVGDYLDLEKVGILAEDDRVELIRGQILSMSPIGPPHGAAVARANRAIMHVVGDQAILWIQGSARLDDYTAPQPDILLVNPREDFYASRLPEPSDMLLIVEVADSSLAYDREIKEGLYAEAGVPEYWIADIPNDRLLVYRDPEGKSYRSRGQRSRGERVVPRLLPDCEIKVSDLLP